MSSSSAISAEATAATTALSGTVDPDLVTTTVISAAPSSTATSGVTAPPSDADDASPRCHDAENEPFPPFCRPMDGSDKYPGNNYYVTWDPDLLPKNSTVTVLLDYVNSTSSTGKNAWTSVRTDNAYGYVIVTMDKEWLQGNKRNNLTFRLNALDGPNARLIEQAGPSVSLTIPPVVHYPGPPRLAPNKLGLAIGIPIGIGFFLFIVFGLFIGMRKHRRIDVGSVMGRRKGYGVGKSRRERVGKKAGIRLGDPAVDLDTRNQYRDQPVQDVELQDRKVGHTREESLGSLVSSPTREGLGEQTTTPRTNAFRDEISRQRTGR